MVWYEFHTCDPYVQSIAHPALRFSKIVQLLKSEIHFVRGL